MQAARASSCTFAEEHGTAIPYNGHELTDPVQTMPGLLKRKRTFTGVIHMSCNILRSHTVGPVSHTLPRQRYACAKISMYDVQKMRLRPRA